MGKKKGPKCSTCTPNCIYFQQDVPKTQVLGERVENGVRIRTVRRDCLYDNTQIKNWNHVCGRKQPHAINK